MVAGKDFNQRFVIKEDADFDLASALAPILGYSTVASASSIPKHRRIRGLPLDTDEFLLLLPLL